MLWHGREIATLRDLLSAVTQVTTKEEAAEFTQLYEADVDEPWIAKANIGYLAGYVDRATAQRIYSLFETEHPIFGLAEPTPDEAFAAGYNYAQQREASVRAPRQLPERTP